jgi:hypothetical protein
MFEELFDNQQELDTRVREVDQIVLAVDIVDIEIVGISPLARPCVVKRKPITAVLEPPAIDVADPKMVFASE